MPPAHTALSARVPSGRPMPEGFPFKIVPALLPTACFDEVTLKPPSLDGGDKIDQTTMYNLESMTALPQILKEWGDITGTCSYDPNVYSAGQIRTTLLNRNGSITFYFQDGSYLDFFGWFGLFDPQEAQKGQRPTANFTIHFSNIDPATGAESNPLYTNVAGT